MDPAKYLTVLAVLCLEGGETGGGGKHHNHVKIHIPEFIHHDHHKKVITIHHHHHKPKKEHHHHHHHHHKPQIPHGHHYHHHHKKTQTKTHTVSKGSGHGHGHHGHHGHHKHHQAKHGHQGHHGHHGQHGHYGQHGHHSHYGHGHHHDAPVAPPVVYPSSPLPSFEDDFGSSFSPSVPSYGGGISNAGFAGPQIPQVHGITHTVKQVKVYDSLPGALPGNGKSHGYEVTEEGEEGDDDVFTAVNGLHHTFPATVNYLRSAAPQPATHDPFAELGPQNTIQVHDPFAPGPTSALSDVESFTGNMQNDLFGSAVPTFNAELPSVQPSEEFPTSFDGASFDGHTNSFTGAEGDTSPFASNEESSFSAETPVTFAREAGIQESTKTGNVETIVY